MFKDMLQDLANKAIHDRNEEIKQKFELSKDKIKEFLVKHAKKGNFSVPRKDITDEIDSDIRYTGLVREWLETFLEDELRLTKSNSPEYYYWND